MDKPSSSSTCLPSAPLPVPIRPSCSFSSPLPHLDGLPGEFDQTLLVIKWLNDNGYGDVAKDLEEKVNERKIVPPRLDWTGRPHEQTCQQFISGLRSHSVPPLRQVVGRLYELVNKDVPLPLPNLSCKIIANPRTSLIRTQQSIIPRFSMSRLLQKKVQIRERNNIRLLGCRELGRAISSARLPHSHFLQNLERHFRVFGHLAHAYCVAFDKNSQFVISGADDHLMKVWDVETGALRYTFRGHSGEVADLSVSHCNRLLASGGVDKTIRVWSLRNGALLEVFRHHTAMISRVLFLPFVHGSLRYLVSCGYDCNLVFVPYDSETLEFSTERLSFNERDGPNNQRIVSLCHSPSGAFVAIGDTLANVSVYRVEAENVYKLTRIKAHSDKVDSLVWAPSGLQFASSSPDGVAKIWKWSRQTWTEASLQLNDDELRKALDSMPSSDNERSRNKLKYSVMIICWSSDNKHIITAGNDKNLRVWDAATQQQVRVLAGHQDDCFVLHPHPTYANIVISCGHDGFLIVWDIERGEIVKKFANQVDQSGHYAFFDLVISSDGMNIAAVDACGQISLFGISDNLVAKATPKQQFFKTDYMDLVQDDNGFVVDEQTGLAPHLMPPPLLVDAELTPHAPEDQRRVPGKETNSPDDEEVCVWLNRNIIEPLADTQCAHYQEDQKALREHESELYEEELAKTPIQQNIFVPLTNKERGRAPPKQRMMTTARGQSRRRQQEEVLTEEQLRQRTNEFLNAYDSDNDENYSLSEEEQESEAHSESDSSDPDFAASGGLRSSRNQESNNHEEVMITTASGRQVRPVGRAWDASSAVQTSNNGRAKERRKRHQQHTEEESSSQASMDDEAGPSTSAQPTVFKEKKVRKRKDEWIRTFPSAFVAIRQQRFPYLPQLGDKVVYFRQGHEFYLQLVELNRLYEIPTKMRRALNETAPVMENCLVEEVKYLRRPYRLTQIRLTQLDQESKPTAKSWTVCYHDLDSCPDFVFLQQHYQRAMSYGFDEGSKIEAILDGKWWTGTVIKKEPHCETVPDSPWFSLLVKWDSGDDEKLSPWDMQPLTKGRKSGDEVTLSDETHWAEYVWETNDWPATNAQTTVQQAHTYHTHRVITAINALKTIDIMQPFYLPVDLSEFPTYPFYIDYPMDLKTIIERIQQDFYRRQIAIHQDIRYLAIAAEQFNEPTSPIVKNARVLVETLIRFSKDESIDDVLVLYYSLQEGPAEELVEYKKKQRSVKVFIDEEILQEAVQMHDEDEATASHEKEENKLPGWTKETVKVFEDILKERAAAPFLDAEQDGQMEELSEELAECNLTTIMEQLKGQKFSNPQEFHDRVRGILQTWKRCVSDNKRSAAYQHTLTLDRVLQEKMRPILDEYNRIAQHYQLQVQREAKEGRLRTRKRKERTPVYQTRSTGAHYYTRFSDGPSTSNNGVHPNGRREAGYYKQLATAGYIDDYEESIGSDEKGHSSSRGESLRKRGSSQNLNGAARESSTPRRETGSSQPTGRKSRRERDRREAESELLDLMDDADERIYHEEAQKQTRKLRKRKSDILEDDEMEDDDEFAGRKRGRRSTKQQQQQSHTPRTRARKTHIIYTEEDSEDEENEDANYEESEGEESRSEAEEEEKPYVSRSGRVTRQKRF